MCLDHLIIDTVKSNRHFVGDHEMFGTLIKGSGLDNRKDIGIIITTTEKQRYEHEWDEYVTYMMRYTFFIFIKEFELIISNYIST
jgi:hypothetical protein